MHDAVTETGERGDRLAAEDRKERDREADPQSGEDDRERRRKEHPAKQLVVGGAHRARQQDDRHRVDAGEQGLEHPDRILRAADQVAERDAGGRGDRECDHELHQRDAQVADELERRDDLDELVVDIDRIGQQDRADLSPGGPDVPGADQDDDEGDLDGAARELAVAVLSHHSDPPPALRRAARSASVDCSIALRISSCSNSNSVLRRLVNFSDVMKLGLRGCGSSIAITSLIVPGRAENTATRSARNTASPRLWVTNTMVFCVRESSTERSSPSTMRVCSSSAPNGSSISRMPVSRLKARASAARWRMPPESWPG